MAEPQTSLAPQSPGNICWNAPVVVVRGKGVAGRHGVVQAASTDMVGFWWVGLYDARGKLGRPVLLAVGQLKRKEPPA